MWLKVVSLCLCLWLGFIQSSSSSTVGSVQSAITGQQQDTLALKQHCVTLKITKLHCNVQNAEVPTIYLDTYTQTHTLILAFGIIWVTILQYMSVGINTGDCHSCADFLSWVKATFVTYCDSASVSAQCIKLKVSKTEKNIFGSVTGRNRFVRKVF